jgi:hypothetical protein
MMDIIPIITVDSYHRDAGHKEFADALLAANGMTPDRCRVIEWRGEMFYGEFLGWNDEGRPYIGDDSELATFWQALTVLP